MTHLRTLLSTLGAAVALGCTAMPAASAPAMPALDPATITVPAGLGTGRVLLVRPARIDVVADGRVRRVVPLAGPLDLARLPALVGDPAYASAPEAGVVRLDATLAQRPGSQVTASGPGLAELRVGSGARLFGTRASLDLDGLAVVIAGGRAIGTDAPVRYTHGSTVELGDVAIRGALRDRPATPPSVQVDEGTALTAEHVRIAGGGEAALRVADAGKVSLNDVVLESASGNGLDVTGGDGLELARVTARENGGIGVVLRQPGDLRVQSGMRATGNRAAGFDLLGLRNIRLSGLMTSANGGPGLQLRSSQDVFLTGVRSSEDVAGVHITGSADVHVADYVSRGSANGLAVKDSARFDANGATVADARDDGITLAGRSLTLADVRVEGAGEGVVIAAGSSGVSMRDSRFGGDRSGVRIAAGTNDVTLRRVTADAPNGVALRSGGDRVLVEGVTATGGVGVDLRGSASIENSSVRATAAALRVAEYGRVGVRSSALSARDLGISAAGGSQVLVTGSTVDARRAVAGDVTFGGDNDVSRQPIRWVGIAGLTAMLLAIGLEVMRKTRERGERVTRAPGHVLNRT